MDPEITVDQMINAMRDGDGPALIEHASDLLRWLDDGGFPPVLFVGVPRDDAMASLRVLRHIASAHPSMRHDDGRTSHV